MGVIKWLGYVLLSGFVGIAVFGNDDDAASLAVSDHRPIWVTLDIGSDDDGGADVPTSVGGASRGEAKLSR